jgi:hypothetical protein
LKGMRKSSLRGVVVRDGGRDTQDPLRQAGPDRI